MIRWKSMNEYVQLRRYQEKIVLKFPSLITALATYLQSLLFLEVERLKHIGN